MAEAELNKLKKKRASMRTLTSKLFTKIETSLEDSDLPVEDLEDLLDQLIDKADALTQLNIDVENLLKIDDIDAEIEASQEYQEKIVTGKRRLTKKIKEFNSKQNCNVSSVETHDRKISENTEVKTVKLPKLSINKFYGDPSCWLEFYNQFESAIHNNSSLSKIDRFVYLKSLLGGTAMNAIGGYALTNENYDAALDLLKNRFGRKDLLINSHISKLLDINALKYSNDITGLRKLYDKAEIQIRSLESLGVVSESYGNLLCPIILKLIPPDLALEFSRSTDTSNNFDLEKLLAFLRKEIESRERTNAICNKAEMKHFAPSNPNVKEFRERDKKPSNQMNKPLRKPSAAEFSAAVNIRPDSCLFCKAAHGEEKCNLSTVEKREVLKKQGRCFLCLKRFHLVKSCLAKVRCAVCSRRHHTSLCEKDVSSEQHPCESETNPQAVVATLSVLPDAKINKDVFLQTATVNVTGKRGNRNVRILIDAGSQRSFVLENISKQLNLEKIGEEDVTIYAFGSNEPIIEKRKVVKLVLRNTRNFGKRITIPALEIPSISQALIRVPGKEIKNYCFRNKLQLADRDHNSASLQLSVLIGSDAYWKVVTGKIRRLSNSLVMSESLFGWTINGSENSLNMIISQSSINVMKTAVSTVNTDLKEDTCAIIRKLWELEAIGITHESDDNQKLEDNLVFKEFENSITFNNNRYTVCFPWNNNSADLKDNFEVSEKRFESLIRKFRRQPQFYERYKAVIIQYLENGIAEEVEFGLMGKTYFMPHQAVIREDKDTTKLRVVYDASSHAENCFSLNDCLDSGPNLYPDILDLLVRFRQHRIAFTADIEQAFLQISLKEEDRNAVKFLWIDGELGNMSFKYKVLRMTRVIFGAKPSPFMLGATIKIHIKKYEQKHPNAFALLNTCLYVDDLIAGTESEIEAIEEAKDIRFVLKEGSFNMRKWKTNNSSVQKLWIEAENCENDSHYCKVLGYIWNKDKDFLKIEIKDLIAQVKENDTIGCKREILRLVGRLYDPIGFLNPFTVRARILLQEIWKHGLDWDTPLPLEFERAWKTWCEELPNIQNIEVPRHYFGSIERKKLKNFQLHCFSDASQKAFGTVVYLRYTIGEAVKSELVVSKARVAPLKKISLPRLELMAALIGARLSKTIKNYLGNLDITSYFWTDSQIVLYWIKGCPENWKPFVNNRTREIQEKSEPSSWNYIPGKENPADLLTRGEPVDNLKENPIWWHGPVWLKNDEDHWPKIPTNVKKEDVELEKKNGMKEIFQASCITKNKTEALFDIKRYSNLGRILRITSWINRFIYNVKKKGNTLSGPLTAEEMKKAEIYWINFIQQELFPEEIRTLKSGKALTTNSKIYLFNPFLDENGTLRIGGRLQNTDFNFSEIHPMVMPESSYLSDLEIKRSHEEVAHAGVSETLTQLREKIWIPKGRQKVKKFINSCIICKRFKAKPMTQDVSPLPADRVKETFPFETTGIDFAGPLYTKQNCKVYIALFTCAVTRAVHLELVSDLTTAKFILAFKRFTSRRGLCKIIFSDNAKTFKRADKDFQKLWDFIKNPEILDYFGSKGIKWKFIVERAAWWGGFWERLVRSTKSCLKKILGRASLGYQELETSLTEVEAILNSRPLTYVYNDSDEPSPLTPGHFLIGRRLVSLPPGKHTTIESSNKTELAKRYRYREALLERIWRRWKRDYLLELRSAHQTPLRKRDIELKKQMVVLIHDERLPRLMWRMGVVTEIHPGRDGKPRACTVRTSNGTYLKRPVQLLYPLELDLGRTSPSGPEDVATSDQMTVTTRD